MGISASVTICYGKEFEEDYEFPWGNDFDIWWRNELGFKHKKELWKEDGSAYIEGVTEKEKDFYYKEIDNFDKANPCPIELISCVGYDNYTCTIVVAIPNPIINPLWEKTTELNPSTTFAIDSDVLRKYHEFMNKYFEDDFDEAKWLITCSWE